MKVSRQTRFLSFFLMMVPLVLAVLSGCEEEDKLTGSNGEGNAVDVSSRISGFGTEFTGAGATLVVQGSELSGVKRVLMSGLWATEVVAEGSSVSFRVPNNVSLGEQEIVLVFSGNARATTTINVVPFPVVEHFEPIGGEPGDEIRLFGNNFDIATAVSFDGVQADIGSSTATTITFILPDGVSNDGPISVITPIGDVASAASFMIGEYILINDFDGNGLATGWFSYGDIENRVVTMDPPPSPVSGNFQHAWTKAAPTAGYAGVACNPTGGIPFGGATPGQIYYTLLINNNGATSTQIQLIVAYAADGGTVNWNYLMPVDWQGWKAVTVKLSDFHWQYGSDPQSTSPPDSEIDPAQLTRVKMHFAGYSASSVMDASIDNVAFIVK